MKRASQTRTRRTATGPVEYAVILDHHRATFPGHWPIVRLGKNLTDVSACRQYEVVTELRPRALWSARIRRHVELVHVPTGDVHQGAICELAPRLRPGTRARRTAARKAIELLMTASTVLALGCSSPQVARRYADATWTTSGAAGEFAHLSAFVVPPGATAGESLLASLGPQAQANFIKAMDARSADATELLRLLATTGGPAMAAGTHPSTIDRTRFRRQLVFSLEKADGLGPADRLDTVTIRLARPVGGAFVSWDKFATQHETVDLGKLTLTRARGFELGPSVGAGETSGSPVGGRAELKLTRTLAEEMSLRQRYVALTGALQPDEARLVQDSAVGIDLAGNAVVQIEIAATPAPAPHDVLRITGLEPAGTATDRRGTAPAPTIQRVALRYPARATPITCQLAGQYRLRKVTAGAATLPEGDDTVMFVTGGFAPAPVQLVAAEDLATRVWGLRTAEDEPLYVAGVGLAEFASFPEAASCCAAVRASTTPTLAGHQLRVAGETGVLLGKDQLAAVKVHVRQLN